ncbi:hypothetical protein FND52_19540 [Atlantibacter subterranea]|nr:hypothetical protein [Atlantibacter subterranea]TSJ50803.1 hypothetical protein FND52_19540 [Atlantibacter subterranea]
MHHLFLEFHSLKPGVPDVQALMNVIRSEEQTAFVISPEVVKFVNDALIVNTTITSFKNCRFAFNEGSEFVEFDAKGKSRRFTETPAWFISPNDFARGQWLNNHQLANFGTKEFINAFIAKFPNVKERREHCNLLFDLQMDSATSGSAQPAPVRKAGNRNRITTKPKIADLGSPEIFTQFYARLGEAVKNNRFPTLQILTGHDDLAKVPNTLKGSVRTWFKAITGELPPNNKRVEAGNAALFCAPIREQLKQIDALGPERYYQALSQAINQAGEQYIADFTFSFPQQSHY